MIDELFKFCYSLKTGKTKATTNPGGLFLTVVGLREAKPKALAKAKNRSKGAVTIQAIENLSLKQKLHAIAHAMNQQRPK